MDKSIRSGFESQGPPFLFPDPMIRNFGVEKKDDLLPILLTSQLKIPKMKSKSRQARNLMAKSFPFLPPTISLTLVRDRDAFLRRLPTTPWLPLKEIMEGKRSQYDTEVEPKVPPQGQILGKVSV